MADRTVYDSRSVERVLLYVQKTVCTRRLLLKSKSLRDFSVFIFGAPNLHGFHDRTHRLPQFRKSIFNPRRDLGITVRVMIPSASIERRLSVSTFWLIPSKSFFRSLNCHGRTSRFRMISSFHLLPIIWTVVATGQAWSSSLVNRYSTSFRMLHSCYSAAYPVQGNDPAVRQGGACGKSGEKNQHDICRTTVFSQCLSRRYSEYRHHF